MIKKTTFAVIAKIQGLSEKSDELRIHLQGLIGLTQNSDGCLSCEMIENEYDSTEFTLIEKWSHEGAYNIHFSTKVIKNALRSFPRLLSRELDQSRQVLRYNTVKYGTNCYCLR